MLERISLHAGPSARRTGTSAIAAGILLFASVFAGYLFSAENDGKVTNVPVLSLYITGFVAGAAALIVALKACACSLRTRVLVGPSGSASGPASAAGLRSSSSQRRRS
jgi:hypothetical protein